MEGRKGGRAIRARSKPTQQDVQARQLHREYSLYWDPNPLSGKTNYYTVKLYTGQCWEQEKCPVQREFRFIEVQYMQL